LVQRHASTSPGNVELEGRALTEVSVNVVPKWEKVPTLGSCFCRCTDSFAITYRQVITMTYVFIFRILKSIR
jgi:hypothetical protein